MAGSPTKATKRSGTAPPKLTTSTKNVVPALLCISLRPTEWRRRRRLGAMLGLVLFLRWGRGAVGSAPRWHRGGRGFESHRLHHLKKPKNLPSKTANCCQHCCQLSIFLLHSNKNLSGLPRKNGYGPLHSHRAHQHRRRQISVRQCAVLEESSSDSDRRSDLLSPSDQWRQAHSD